MKKEMSSVAAVAALGLLGASSAFAATNGTVTFNGEITSQTCTIKTADVDKTVTLPTVSTSALAQAGAIAGTTPFTITVTDCSALPTTTPATGDKTIASNGIKFVAAHFETTNWNPATKNVKNATGSGRANNVEVRLFKSDGTTQLPLGSAGDYVSVTTGGGGGTTRGATMNFVGGYYATDASTAGTVSAVATYTLAYQ